MNDNISINFIAKLKQLNSKTSFITVNTDMFLIYRADSEVEKIRKKRNYLFDNYKPYSYWKTETLEGVSYIILYNNYDYSIKELELSFKDNIFDKKVKK